MAELTKGYNVKFVKGTASRYNELVAAGSIDNLTFYYLTDSADLYLGSVLLSNEPEVRDALDRILVLEGLVGQEKADGKDATGIFAELESIKAELGALTGNEGGIAEAIEDAIAALEEKLAPSLKQIEDNKTAIATEKERAEGAEKDLSDALKAHKDAMDEYHEGIDQAIANLVAADLTINGAIGAVGEKVTAVEETLNGKEGAVGLIKRVKDVEGVASTNSGAITTLVGSDGGKSVRTISSSVIIRKC